MRWSRVAGSLFFLAGPFFVPAGAVGQEEGPRAFPFTRILEDSAGISRFSDDEIDLELVDPGRGIQPTPGSTALPATGMRVFCPPPSGSADWHPVPGRVINIILSGEVDIEVGDGETRRFGAGSLILGEDTEGAGHRTRVGPGGACFAMLPLGPDQ